SLERKEFANSPTSKPFTSAPDLRQAKGSSRNPITHAQSSIKQPQLPPWGAKVLGRELRTRPDPVLAAAHLKQRADLFCENALAFNPCRPAWVVQFCSTTNSSDARKHLPFLLGKMVLQPAFKTRTNGKGQSHDGVAGELSASFGARLQNHRHFVIS